MRRGLRIGGGIVLAAASTYATAVGAHEIATEDVKPSEFIGGLEVIGGSAAASAYLLVEPVRKRVKAFLNSQPYNLEPQVYVVGEHNNEFMISESSIEANEQEQEPETIPQVSQTLFRL
jgi:ABC-type amino acid transport substrate-binding protein